ncbi:hypothetical protein N5D52_07625 [Pseudomonas sp. GD03860]|uniref:hypothetical protein n=1 Tax=Pseudomonas TaxID=286 RepID=UPI0023644171|nr:MULTISPECIES: hypothetical protein [Pseudomonas]MDD2059249.1 hypothetical protein [Pseudomonas putida]MDH0636804.1 hypothetical protein [Pseudomonas sp. GD03860]
MSQDKAFRVLQSVKNVVLSALAALSLLLVPLVWVPLIVGDWLLEKLKRTGPRR